MRSVNIGAIDIGSNAVRFLVMRAMKQNGGDVVFKKVNLFRLPVRLGADSFVNKKLSESTLDKFLKAMEVYKNLISIYDVERYRACATSAMRELSNGDELVERIKNEIGIDIEIIDGKEEARIIQRAHFKQNIDTQTNYLYVDVGGGSTEISFLSGGEIIFAKSFKIGTIRLLKNLDVKDTFDELKAWVKEKSANFDAIEMIGSGGNINKLYKLAGFRTPEVMDANSLRNIQFALKECSYEQRIYDFGLNPDRADVIVPASEIYLAALNYSGADKIHVPKIGVADGVVQELYVEIEI